MLSKQPREADFINAVIPYSFYSLHQISDSSLFIHIFHHVDDHRQNGCICYPLHFYSFSIHFVM